MSETGVNSCLTLIQSRLDEIADEAGVTGSARLSIDDTLAALPGRYRRRLGMFLESLRAFSPDPAQRSAVEMLLERAASAWGETPAHDGPPLGGPHRPGSRHVM